MLLDYGSGKLDRESAAALERHIALCGACREFARRQSAVWEAMDGWKAAPVSADFDRRLYRRIEAQASWWELWLRPFRPFEPVALRRALSVAALACLLFVAGVLLQYPAVGPAQAPSDMAQVDAVQPEQVERTLDAMEMLNEFSHHVRTETPNSKL